MWGRDALLHPISFLIFEEVFTYIIKKAVTKGRLREIYIPMRRGEK